MVSPHVSRLHHCMPLGETDRVLTVAMVNPLDLIAIEDLELASRCQVNPVVSTKTQIEARLLEFYGDTD
jgi:type IV pilus assembly protein PilB